MVAVDLVAAPFCFIRSNSMENFRAIYNQEEE